MMTINKQRNKMNELVRQKKPHVLKQEVVCSVKHKGGLGVRSLSTLNKALLSKWIWHFAV